MSPETCFLAAFLKLLHIFADYRIVFDQAEIYFLSLKETSKCKPSKTETKSDIDVVTRQIDTGDISPRPCSEYEVNATNVQQDVLSGDPNLSESNVSSFVLEHSPKQKTMTTNSDKSRSSFQTFDKLSGFSSILEYGSSDNSSDSSTNSCSDSEEIGTYSTSFCELLSQVHSSIQILHRNNQFPFNPGPLLKLIENI